VVSESDGLRGGTSGPRNFIVERGPPDTKFATNTNPPTYNKPWSTLSNLIRFRSEQLKKLPRVFRQRGSGIADIIESTVPAPQLLETDINVLVGVGDRQSTELNWRESGSKEERRVDNLSRTSTGFNNSIHTTVKEHDGALRQPVATEPANMAAGSASGANYDPEADQIIRLSVDSAQNRTCTDGTEYATRTLDSSSSGFCTSAISIRDHLGAFGSVKVLYDTGCPDNIITPNILDRYNIPLRPLFVKDVRVYEAAGGTLFTVTHYVEIDIKDDGNAMRDFEKVFFYVAKSMGGWDCILGRKFMNAHNFKMTASSGPACAVLVLTKKKISKGTII
jgi:hypothetical protein